jgi:F0F1-type ATP synthase assembly protein I
MRKSTYVFVTAAAVAGALALGGVARAGDVEIVNPSTGQAAPAAPAPAVVPVQPVQEQAPVAAPQTQTQRVVHEDVQAPHNVMTTITVSALMGGIAGLLVGGAIYYLADNQAHAARIGIWAAGGVLVGTGVGIVQVAADESRASTAVSQLWSPDPARTYRLALFRTSF